MLTKSSGLRVAAFAFGLLLLTGAARAQFVPPPVRPSIDENGVELVSGQLSLNRTDFVVGQPGSGGLSFGEIGRYSQWGHWQYLGTVIAANGPVSKSFTVSLDDYTETFTKANSPSNSPIVSVQGRGSTLAEDASSFTYTSPDGEVAVFSKSVTNVGPSLTPTANITSLTLPDGEVRTYTYVSVSVCSVTGSCSTTTPERRLQSVTNNRGYHIKLTYADSRINTTISYADSLSWYYKLSGAMGLNMAVDYCSPTANQCSGTTQTWPSVTYSTGSTGVGPFTVTDLLGNVTTYNGNAIRLPGSQSDDVTYMFDPNTGTVSSVNRNGRVWNYAYAATATELTATVTEPGPPSRQSTYVFDATTRSINRYTNTVGEVTTYLNDSSGRPSVVTLPTGETVRYQYDARGNVSETRHTSFPAGSPDLFTTAGYDSTCTASTAKKCNKANWTKDPLGNQTDYVYGTAHGNPTSITLPAPAVGGIRPVISYTYTASAAYYKNSSGSIVAASTSVYYLTSVAQCRTTSGCTATSADQLRTDIGYGANSVANNRLPVQTTVRNGSGTLIATTDLQYDVVGNLVAVDGPLTGAVDKTVTRYDALRRVVGTISPDPDGAAGPRLNIGVKTTYDARGLPALVERGNLTGQTDSDWLTLVASQSLLREFDAARRVTKVSSVGGQTTYAVQQVSFDTLGRVNCSTTRMNPVYFSQALPEACTATSDGSFGPDRIVQYGYDSADRVTSVTSGLGVSPIVQQAMTYLARGRLSTLTDGRGNKTSYEYDGYSRPLRTRYPDPTNGGVSSSTDYEDLTYDLNSQVVATRRRGGEVVGTPRDALGRVTSKDVPAFDGGSATADDVYFSYDNQGRVLGARYGSTTGVGIVLTYDGLGRTATRTVFGRQLSYSYDLRGRRTQLLYPDGGPTLTYAYSNVDELLSLTDTAGSVETYGYDALGARTSLSPKKNGVPTGASTGYTPDAIGRLQTLTQDFSGTSFDVTTTFAYNPAGQIISKSLSNDAAYTPIPSPLTSTTNAQFDGQNQVTNLAGTDVTDDANANVLTGVNSLTYKYDALGQLRKATGGANQVNVTYDPAGMLHSLNVGGTTTEYLYDGPDLIAEYNGSGSAVLRRFVHGASSDEPLVTYEGSGTTNPTWLHADERGSIIAASNATGIAGSSVKYDSDGGSGTLASPFGYAGQLYLPEVQLYYNKARMYSPKTGRFLRPDPIGYSGGMNMYRYAGGDPINQRDPSGLQMDRDPYGHPCYNYCDYTGINSGAGWLFILSWFGSSAQQPGTEAEGSGAGSKLPSPILDKVFTPWGGWNGFLWDLQCLWTCQLPGTMDLESQLSALGPSVGRAVGGLKAISSGAGAAVRAIENGTTIYRVFGGEARGLGRSWTTVNPGSVENFREAAGLWPENSGQFIVEGRLTSTEGVTLRDALPGPNGVGGGLPEVFITNPGNQVCILCVSGVNPSF